MSVSTKTAALKYTVCNDINKQKVKYMYVLPPPPFANISSLKCTIFLLTEEALPRFSYIARFITTHLDKKIPVDPSVDWKKKN